jgi:nucleoside-diphosphate-sugar epimerase
MELKNKKILVTGAGGFIGSNLIEELIKKGGEISAFLNNPQSLDRLKEIPNWQEKIEIIFGDLRDFEQVKKAIKGKDVVFHLGALISASDSSKSPRSYFETNCLGTLNVLIASKEENVKKILISSTSQVYGKEEYNPINENHPLNPLSIYAASKISAEKFSESFYHSYNLPVSIIRLFNVFGPRQSIEPLIPALISRGLKDEKIDITNLDARRDFIYVKDAVNAFIQIAESENSNGETFNIGSGTAHSIKEILDMLSLMLNKELLKNVNLKNLEKGNETLLICDNKKAEKLIGWKPIYSFEEGLTETVNYLRGKLL